MKLKVTTNIICIILSLTIVHTASAGIFSSDKSPAEERETIQKERNYSKISSQNNLNLRKKLKMRQAMQHLVLSM